MISTSHALPLTLSEADFQDTVIDYAKLRGWLVAHFRPAQVRPGKWVTPMQGDPGFPDLVLARDCVVHVVELKRHGGRLRPAQTVWIAALGGMCTVWTPGDWAHIVAVLA